MPFTKSLATTILTNNFTNNPNLVLALYTVAPAWGTAGTEVATADYQRQPITFSNPADSGDGHMQVQNTAKITFPKAQENWGTIVALGIIDTSTGTLLDFDSDNINVTVNTNYQFFLDISGYTVKLD